MLAAFGCVRWPGRQAPRPLRGCGDGAADPGRAPKHNDEYILIVEYPAGRSTHISSRVSTRIAARPPSGAGASRHAWKSRSPFGT